MADLGAASPYAILSGASVGNTVSAPGAPHTTIRGDLGVKADTAPTGFPPGVVTGTIRQGSPVDPAHVDATSAYNEIANRAGGEVIAGALVGAILSPGLYTIAGAASNTGTLTLDGGGNPDAVFVFQINGALSFAATSHVVLANGAQASRVFWQVNGAGAIGAGADFVGTMIAADALALGNGTLLNGRAIALGGALTLDNNQVYGAPPAVSIDGGATAFTTDSIPTLSGTTDLDPPGEVTVTIAGQILTAIPVDGSWSVTSEILANGTYPVVASVTDVAGNPGSAIQQLTIDTIPPEIAVDGGATVTTDRSAPTIGGTSDVAADTVVRVTIASQNLNALVQGDGSWNIRATALSDGIYEITVSVSDPAGNESVALQSMTIDTAPPAVTISGGADPVSQDAAAILSGFADVAPGTTVTVIVDNQTLSGTVDDDQLWSVTADTLPDGIHRFTVIVSDTAGNQTRVEHLLTVDTVVPPGPVVDAAPSIRRLAIIPRKVSLSDRDKDSLRRLGPKVKLNLTETATVRFRITGKRSRGYTFLVRRGAGTSFLRIPKKFRRKLRHGRHRMTAAATDSAGQISLLERAVFRVIR